MLKYGLFVGICQDCDDMLAHGAAEHLLTFSRTQRWSHQRAAAQRLSARKNSNYTEDWGDMRLELLITLANK